MSQHFWIIETLRIEVLPQYGHHWHIVFSEDRPTIKVIAGPFPDDYAAIDWLNLNRDNQPKPIER